MKNTMPNSIRVASGEEYSPRYISVQDAATGDTVPGVMSVTIRLSHEDMLVDIVHTMNWPTTEADLVVNLSEQQMLGKTDVQGVACVTSQYWLRGFYGTARLLKSE